jgi:hypothetical protein
VETQAGRGKGAGDVSGESLTRSAEMKHQTPSSKFQRITTYQAPKGVGLVALKRFGVWGSELLWCLVFGIWIF